MIDPSDRETLDDVLTRYALGELDGEEARELAALRGATGASHRGRTPAAHRRPAALRRGAHAARPISAAASSRRPSEVDAAPAPRSSTPISPPTAARRHHRASSARSRALLIVALAWDSYRLRQELGLQQDVATTLQQPNVVRQFALAGNGLSLAVGTAVLDLDAKRAAVVIRGLPKLPAGQVLPPVGAGRRRDACRAGSSTPTSTAPW